MPTGEHGLAYSHDGDDDMDIVQVIQPGGLAAIAKSETESQLDAAHKYPRKISQFMADAQAMVSRSSEVAAMCYYTIPRGGKKIMGPSVRLAEIVASAYGNLHIGARPIDIGETDVTCQGIAWDLQRNLRITVEKKRRITNSNGERFNEDMIMNTINACSSIVLRDATFRVVPRTYVQELFDLARQVAVGEAKAIGVRRKKTVDRLIELGATEERILATFKRTDVEGITPDDLEKLIGFGTAIMEGSTTVDKCFPPLAAEAPAASAPEGQRMSLGGEKKPTVKIDTSAVREPGSEG